MEAVRELAAELSHVVLASGIDARGRLHALAEAAAGKADSENVAVLVADESGTCLFYPNGRRFGVLACWERERERRRRRPRPRCADG